MGTTTQHKLLEDPTIFWVVTVSPNWFNTSKRVSKTCTFAFAHVLPHITTNKSRSNNNNNFFLMPIWLIWYPSLTHTLATVSVPRQQVIIIHRKSWSKNIPWHLFFTPRETKMRHPLGYNTVEPVKENLSLTFLKYIF